MLRTIFLTNLTCLKWVFVEIIFASVDFFFAMTMQKIYDASEISTIFSILHNKLLNSPDAFFLLQPLDSIERFIYDLDANEKILEEKKLETFAFTCFKQQKIIYRCFHSLRAFWCTTHFKSGNLFTFLFLLKVIQCQNRV